MTNRGADPSGGGQRAPEAVLLPPELLDSVRLTRRSLLKYSALLSAVGLVELRGKGLLSAARALAAEAGAVVTASVTRADDMLSLRFEFINFTLESGPARLVRADQGSASYVVVHFEPQAIAEEAFFESSPNDDPSFPGTDHLPTPPIRARLARPSRLAFFVPFSIDEIPFNLDNLLNWDQFSPNVVPVAKLPVQGEIFSPAIREPKKEETSIEAPWNLVISPREDHSWTHRNTPVVHEARTELWHTRLDRTGRFVVRGSKPQLLAVWTPGFQKSNPPAVGNLTPFRMSLTKRERFELVRLTSDYKASPLKPKSVDVNLLMLSPLGAWMDVRQDWSPPATEKLDVIHWSHRATMGRDSFVKVVLRGYLYPFGHSASLVKITERKLQGIEKGSQTGATGAFLRQRMFIVVRQPEMSFSKRDMPFKTVTLQTLITPDLDRAEDDSIHDGKAAFWPRVGGADFLFHLQGTDKDGDTSEFTAPLPFVVHSSAITGSVVDKVISAYLKSSNSSRRHRPMQGQKIAMAASTPTRPGDTALEIKDFEFKTEKLGTGAPRWRAQLRTAKVRLQAVEQVKGAGLDSAIVEFHPKYVEDGFTDKNAASEVFVRLKEVVKLDYGAGAGADRSGGLVTPNMEISGISRKTGPIGGDLTGGNPPPKFKPGDFFKGATILGGIPLEEILKVTGFDKAPELLSRTIYPGDDTSLPPEAVETTLTWSLKGTADLKPDALKLFEPLSNASLDITAMFRAPVNGEPDYEIVGDLRNFKIHMIGKPSAFLILTFNKLTFTSKKGKSPDVDVDIEEVVFAGILTFVNELKDFMNFGGNGLSIDVTPTAIDAGYTLTLPNISVGIFSLQNISLFAGVKIPFTGKPVSARFAFCRPDAQFLLTYTIFGGGGFVQLTVGEDPKTHDFGMQLLEAGMEFGANASIDIGVASGGVHIMAGIYFAIGTTEDCDDPIAQLSGYVRLGGELDVMGIISISLEFRMGLTYDFNEDVVWGQATLVVEVDVLLFSGSVELTVEKRFGGGGDGDEHLCTPGGSSPRAAIGTFTHATAPQPITFGDLMTADEWTDEYAAAFAPEAFV